MSEEYSAVPRYTYETLPQHTRSRSIRIFVLEPGTWDDPLQGRLITNSAIVLGSKWHFALEYEALSYFWGDATLLHALYIDGRPLPITDTLQDALQYLRYSKRERRIWIDQICIDQRSLSERNEQVQQMGKIYSGASTVTAWLGKASAASNVILGGLAKMPSMVKPGSTPDDRYKEEELENGHPVLKTMNESLRAAVHKHHPGHWETSDWRSVLVEDLGVILSIPWFKRMWIVQEAGLARSVSFQAGNQQAPWKQLAGLVNTLSAAELRTLKDLIFITDLIRLRDQVTQEMTSPRRLDSLVSRFCDREVTDARDKVFALLGVSSDFTHSGNVAEPLFRTDYTKSVKQVFMDFTVWCLQYYHSTEVLTACCAQRKDDRCDDPSWIRDWYNDIFSRPGWSCLPLLPSIPDITIYNAAGRTRTEARHMADESKILLSGLRFDIVDDVVTTWPRDGDPSSQEWIEWKKFALKHPFPGARCYRADSMETFWRTLIMDESNHDNRASSQVGEHFEALIDGPERCFKSCGWFSGRLQSSETACLNFADWLKEFDSKHETSRIFRTRRGNLGISCHHIRREDLVCILYGGRLPFLLRENGRVKIPANEQGDFDSTTKDVMSYQLIGGECYVHGIAHGEALSIAEDEG